MPTCNPDELSLYLPEKLYADAREELYYIEDPALIFEFDFSEVRVAYTTEEYDGEISAISVVAFEENN